MPDSVSPELAHHFTDFAHTYPHLPLYSAIARGVADDPEVASLLTVARPGQARPVLLLAALHDLVLRSPDVAAARWYSSVGGSAVGSLASGGDPWPDVRSTLISHAASLRATIATRSTQTNEVNRVVFVAALLAAAACDVPSAPVALVELGCSAGLLLGLDRYRISVGTTVVGDPSSPVACAGSLRPGSAALATPSPPTAPSGSGDAVGWAGSGGLPVIVERVGLDLAPVALDDADEVRWLEACLWPDQPERLERFRAAVARLRPDPPLVVAGDMVDDLASVAHSARAVATAVSGADGVHLVVMSNWALTYVKRDRRPLIASTLADLAADGRPVSWLTAEPPGAVPGITPPPDIAPGGETVLGLRRWRQGRERPPTVVGTAHPHAPWLHLL